MSEHDEYRNILVVGDLTSPTATVTLELLGKARELAERLGVWVYGVTLFPNGGKNLISYGADVVYQLKEILWNSRLVTSPEFVQSCVGVLDQVIRKTRPEIILFPATPLGHDLAPRIAQRFSTGLVTGCVGLDLEVETRMLVAIRPLFQSRLLAEVVFPYHRPQMVIVEPGVFPQAFEDPSREGRVEEIILNNPLGKPVTG
ncbi:MAG: electron transfer flavoprotein subunit alpha/FixB family protein [Nitrospiria bacterium]